MKSSIKNLSWRKLQIKNKVMEREERNNLVEENILSAEIYDLCDEGETVLAAKRLEIQYMREKEERERKDRIEREERERKDRTEKEECERRDRVQREEREHKNKLELLTKKRELKIKDSSESESENESRLK
ncbi:protein enabled homolog [Macrobrachium rosenbergii]|uniref:protein enabled homolog n=1 Tax=Macrobrachium rosenbergii TaxID=79674 RepID=UPI0034D7AF1A